MNSYISPMCQEEKRQHSTILVPYSLYDCRLPELFQSVPMHWHKEFELNYIREGTGIFFCGDEHFTACKGDILVIPPGMMHAAYMDGEPLLRYDAFVFNETMIGENSNDRCTNNCIRPIISRNAVLMIRYGNDCREYKDLKDAVEHVITCAKDNDPVSDLLMKSELMRFLWVLIKNGCVSDDVRTGASLSEMIRPAVAYMTDNFNTHIVISDLAGMVHMSDSYFMKCFKNAVGVSAIDYLCQIRINAACEMLVSGERSVSEIALECGYDNLSNFNKQFKRIAGCTPREYMKESIETS